MFVFVMACAADPSKERGGICSNAANERRFSELITHEILRNLWLLMSFIDSLDELLCCGCIKVIYSTTIDIHDIASGENFQ